MWGRYLYDNELEEYIMSIKFITEENEFEYGPTFEQVEDNQFFINGLGSLCQKVGERSYNIIACKGGDPYAAQREYKEDRVKKILKKVTKIEF